MWSPTHIQVLVKRAKGLKIKGKDGTNDSFVTIGLGKEKYQTSVKEKSSGDVEWCEQCELAIPQQGNTAEVVLTALHRNFLGVDEFLGVVVLPLKDFDVYEKPKTKWYQLQCKPGQKKKEYRGELEVRTSFTVKALVNAINTEGSTADLTNKKNKGSLQSLNKAAASFGGSLMSLGQKEKKNLKKFAKTVTHKVEKAGEKAKKNLSRVNLSNITSGSNGSPDERSGPPAQTLPNKFSIKELEKSSPNNSTSSPSPFTKTNTLRKSTLSRNRDPGVNSDDEDFEGQLGEEDDMFRFDALSHRSSGSSLSVANNLGTVSKTSTPLSGSLENIAAGDMLRKAFNNSAGTPSFGSARRNNVAPPSPLTSTTIKSSSKALEPLDEWEQKLLGKKSTAPFVSPLERNRSSDTIGQFSLQSGGSQNNSRTNTLERQTPKNFPESLHKNSTIQEETPTGRKKIIPVTSDFESSPSPEMPSSPTTISPFKKSLTNITLSTNTTSEADEDDLQKKKKSFGLKWKRNLVETGRATSLFNLNSFKNKGFREKDEVPKVSKRESVESLSSTNPFGHSRTHSSGSGASGTSPTPGNPPSGPRVVLGRETTPTPQYQGPSRIPKEVWDRFEGKSREDLIETIVNLQNRIEGQARKQSDLEDYIDSLLMKVLSTAPCLLQKETEESFSTKLKPTIK